MPRFETEINQHIDEKPLRFARETVPGTVVSDTYYIRYQGATQRIPRVLIQTEQELVSGTLYEGQSFEKGESVFASKVVTFYQGETNVSYQVRRELPKPVNGSK